MKSKIGGRLVSAMKLPWFTVFPPLGYGVLTTTGRNSGKSIRRCIRAIRGDGVAYLVAIGGERSGWVKNIDAHAQVRLRIRGGTYSGIARRVRDGDEAQRAWAAYCETVTAFDFMTSAMHSGGRSSRSRIMGLTRQWFDTGTPLLVELHPSRRSEQQGG